MKFWLLRPKGFDNNYTDLSSCWGCVVRAPDRETALALAATKLRGIGRNHRGLRSQTPVYLGIAQAAFDELRRILGARFAGNRPRLVEASGVRITF